MVIAPSQSYLDFDFLSNTAAGFAGRRAKQRNVGHEDVLLAILSLPNAHPGRWISNRNISRDTVVKTTLLSYK